MLTLSSASNTEQLLTYCAQANSAFYPQPDSGLSTLDCVKAS